MRLLADENIDRLLIAAFRDAGHDVIAVSEEKSGYQDIEVFRYACETRRILITDDLGFGHLADLARNGDHRPLSLCGSDRWPASPRVQRILEVFAALGGFFLDHVVVIGPLERYYGRIRQQENTDAALDSVGLSGES